MLLLFAAVLAWELSCVPAVSWTPLVRRLAWWLAGLFVAFTVVSWTYAFTTPNVFATAITVCLVAAAWAATKPMRRSTRQS